ncbi:MAG TPA: CPBP family intramembrane glutamic endopeptidase, partial [Polyangiaceae bacterium]|nr:CPBP family intramembrane glutamic endopeptidase [Polyangiaceae bacterium]
MGPRLRGGRKPEPTSGVSAVLMRLVFAALIYNFGFTSGMRVAQHAAPTWAATWAGLGAGCFMLATTFALELPSARMPTQALKSELLEMLPLSRLSKLVLVLAQASLTLPVAVGLSTTLHLQMAPASSLAGAVLLAALLFTVFGLLGSCTGKCVRLALSAYRASRLSWLSSLPMMGGVLLLQLAPTLERLPRPPFGDALGRALVGRDVSQACGVLGAIALFLGAAFFRLERGYELAEPVRPGPTPSAFTRGVDLARLERVLNRREPGGAFQLPFAAFFSAAIIGILCWKLPQHDEGRLVWSFAALIVLQLTSTIGMQRATRGATRDMLARPLLGALPIAPSDTLRSKASALTRSLLLVASPIVLVLGAGYGSRPLFTELWWRVVTALWAVAIYASAATYVAFLTAGLGSTRPRGGVFGSLESFLLAIPFASALFAPGPASAAISLLTLGALTFEARRAALGTIDWLDDPAREHATEVWKALVVFGGFQGTQLLTQQLALAFGGDLPKTAKLLVAYSVAALALWLMTQRAQETGAPQLLPRLAPLGLVAGALSAGCAWLYLRVLGESAAEGATPFEVHGASAALTLVFVIAVVAPIVEERFFRGWLQPALEGALGGRRYLAPLFTALAFAAAHPAYSFVPVLVLGLLNGFLMLRFRSLSACILAHALHNAFAL